MNCLNNEIIQAYIDGELSVEKEKSIDFHLKDCEICRNNVKEYRNNLDVIKQAFQSINVDDKSIEIPPLSIKKKRKPLSRMRMVAYIAAASVALLVAVFSITKEERPVVKRQALSMAEWEYMQQTNGNAQWQERSVNVIITDSNGEIIYTSNTADE